MPYPLPYLPPPVVRPLSTSTKGAKILTFMGIGLLVLMLAAGVGGGFLFASGVSQAQEEEYVDEVVLPGETATVRLAAGTSYTLRSVRSYRSTVDWPTVTDPAGIPVKVRTVSSSSTSGWRFRSSTAGSYQIAASPYGSPLELSRTDPPGIASTVGGVFTLMTATFLGLIAVGMIIGGGIWWSARAKNARRAVPTAQTQP